MRYSKGICWIGDCRIPFVDADKEKINFDRPRLREGSFDESYNGHWSFKNLDVKEYNQQGRFTPNLLVCDDMLNDGVISKSGKNTIRKSNGFNKNAYGIGIGIKEGDNNGEYGDSGSSSRYYDLDKWFDNIIDEIQ